MKSSQDMLVEAIVGDAEASEQLADRITGSLPGQRLLRIYQRNYMSRMSAALVACFPQMQRLLGERYFLDLTDKFIRQYAFAEASLLHYGSQFAEFLRCEICLKGHGYWVDLAALEWAVEVAYNRAAPAAEAYQSISLRAGLQLIPSDYALYDIWSYDGSGELDVSARVQWVLVYSEGYEVMLSVLSAEQGMLLQDLLAAGTEVQAEVMAALSSEQRLIMQNLGIIVGG